MEKHGSKRKTWYIRQSLSLRRMSLIARPIVSEMVWGSYPTARPTIDHNQPQLAPSAGSGAVSIKIPAMA